MRFDCSVLGSKRPWQAVLVLIHASEVEAFGFMKWGFEALSLSAVGKRVSMSTL